MPLMLTAYSLGLIPATLDEDMYLELEFAFPDSNESVRIRSSPAVTTRHGLWALLVRPGKKWRRYGNGPIPADFASDLRDDILANRRDLVAAVHRRRSD